MAKKKSKNASKKKAESKSSSASDKKREDVIVQKTEQKEETETSENTNEPQASKSYECEDDGGSMNVSTSKDENAWDRSDESWETAAPSTKSGHQNEWDKSGGRSSFQTKSYDDKYRPRNYRDDDRKHNKSGSSDYNQRGYSRRSVPLSNTSSYEDRRERRDDNWRQGPSRQNNKGDRRKSYEDRDDSEYGQFQREFRRTRNPEYVKTIEIDGDLFKMPEDYALAHCVAEDMNMGSGIAVQFRYDFKRVDELLNQGVKTGGLAVLQHKNRFIYYLVTKRFSTGKPTYQTLFSSLVELRRHIIEHEVRKLAMPRIGCGLDRLEWDEVKFMIEFVFKKVELEIRICNLQMTEDAPQQRHRCAKLTNETYPIEKIEEETVIIYLCSEDDSDISDEMKALNEKFNFLPEFQRMRKLLGNVVSFTKHPKYLLCGCIVKKRKTDNVDFTAFQKCLRSIQKENAKTKFYYVAMQAFRDKNDPSIMFKIINLLRNSMRDMEVYICWPGDLQDDLLAKDSYSGGGYKPSADRDYRRQTMDPEVLRRDTKNETDSWGDAPPMETADTSTDCFNTSETKDNHNTSLTTGMDELGVDDHQKECWSEEDESKDVHQHAEEQNIQQLPQKDDGERKRTSPNKSQYSSRLKQAGNFENSDSQSCKKQKQFHQDPTHKSDNTLPDLSQEFEKYEAEEIQLIKVTAKQLPKKYSRVCYAREDMIIESGIPKGSDVTPLLGELLTQNQKEGNCGLAKDNSEFLYFPIVRGVLTTPSRPKIFSALQKLRDHVRKNNTKKLVVPKMEDDDSVPWSELDYMLEFLFKNDPVEIVVDVAPVVHNIKIDRNRLKHVKFTIYYMKKKSILLYLASVDGKFTKSMTDLKQKYDFEQDFVKAPRNFANVIRYKENEEHVIYGCVVRRTLQDAVNFVALQKCLNEVNRQNSKNEKLPFAYLQVEQDIESNVNYKMGTLLLTCLPECTIFLGWPGELFKKVPSNYP